ncbi:disulfide bond formation protein B [Halocalculus aciditolerans]|uniref:Disulfide bond formation protein DsbB n=1 Tax=Halocalculus aciditolerans TaxID=1383812 RepID=A0A830FHI3_9EURY|nr:disulfide bond formation protein B [Halocalculus aciditolerans]GGL56638.1 hypothetical protein GCM10009039_13470 [Halocalculus aciditolerans]
MADSAPTPRRTIALAFAVAVVATAGSLSYSLVMGLHPCHLCWYQRVLMYPLTAIAAYAFLTRDAGVWRLVLPFSVLGAAVAAYHSWLQLTGTACGFGGGGCTAVQYRLPALGLSIPNQSLLAFLAITALMGWLALSQR